MKKISIVVVIVLSSICLYSQDTTQKIIEGRVNSPVQQEKPYVILISADGCRSDMIERFQAVNLMRLSGTGVKASYMLPSFPSLTFPNHYTIVTGLYPAHHGLVDNSFYDRKRKQSYTMSDRNAVSDGSWYAGTPLWVLAEQQKMVSASFYWVASESAIQGIRPSYYYLYSDKISIDKRIDDVKNWLSLPPEKRPHLITFYFSEIDHAAHRYGPDAEETRQAMLFVDSSVGKLVDTIASLQLPVNYIFISDHGMTTVDYQHPMGIPTAVDTTKFIIPRGDALLQLYAINSKDILPTYKALQKQAVDFDVYLKKNIPARWHYNKKYDRFSRIGDILLVPHLPKVFSRNGRPTTPGKHGFDPAIKEMHATFCAWGPVFKNGQVAPPFENIHVYPLIAHILGLSYDKKSIDGQLSVLVNILRSN